MLKLLLHLRAKLLSAFLVVLDDNLSFMCVQGGKKKYTAVEKIGNKTSNVVSFQYFIEI